MKTNKNKNQSDVSIEDLILKAKNKNISVRDLIQAMFNIDFFIACSKEELTNKEIILPVCTEIDNESSVCVFTRKKWAEAYISRDISIVKLKAIDWIKQHPSTHGLIINPNHDACINFSSLGVKRIVDAFVLNSKIKF